MIRREEWGTIAYEEAMVRMEYLHRRALEEGEDYLILCEHLPVYTVGSDATLPEVPCVRSDRGGSITYHAPGQLIWYFCFHIGTPVRFYRSVVRILERYLKELDPRIAYDRHRPGFYIQNRKLLSLGFRYSGGVSRHGIALNVDLDLAPFRKIRPCNLEGVVPTSLCAEGIACDKERIRRELTQRIVDGFTL